VLTNAGETMPLTAPVVMDRKDRTVPAVSHQSGWWRSLVTGMLAMALPLSAWAKDAAPQKPNAGELTKLVAKWDEVRKQGTPGLSSCESIAKDFEKFGNAYRAAEGFFNAGAVWDVCGNATKAQALYRQALTINAKFSPALTNLGYTALRAGDLAMAQQQFEAARELDPRNVQAYNGEALVLFEKAKAQNNDRMLLAQAVQKLRRALALDAESLPAYSLLALIYYTASESDRLKLDLAELVCKQAKERNDKYPQIYNTLGLIKLRKNNVTGALREFRNAVQYDPKYVEAQLNIGAITLSSRDYKSAEEAFKAVVDAQPANQAQLFDATMGMAVALRGQRRIDEAEQWYAKAKSLNAKDCAIPYNLGILYQDYKASSETDLTKARTYFNEYNSCKGALAVRVQDAQRRVKDIDETFKALAEQKKIEEENRKLQEEMERQQKQQEQQRSQDHPQDQKQPAQTAPPQEQEQKQPAQATPGKQQPSKR
jgi:tetratricopeptide (TPR) repeat protein